MKWITRERPKIDRVACPWLIARFVDDAPEFLFVQTEQVQLQAIDLAPQCAGLRAISLGLSRNFSDDHEQLTHSFVMYDALYSWLKSVRNEQHDRNPQSHNS